MKSIIRIYCNSLEIAFLSMMVISLLLIAIAGSAYGNPDRWPALWTLITLVFILLPQIDRKRILREHPEIKEKLFKEVQIFFFLLQANLSRVVSSFSIESKKMKFLSSLVIVLRIGTILVVAITIYTQWLGFATNAELKTNIFQSEADVEIDATFFNDSIVIDVIEISSRNKVIKAVIHSQDPDKWINNQGEGYETIIIKTEKTKTEKIKIKIEKIKPSSVIFSAEKLLN